MVGLFALWSAALQGINWAMVGQDRYVSIVALTHGRTFVITGLAPSLSTLWYLGMELFSRFTRYMTVLIAGTPYLVILPLWIRLSGYPEALVSDSYESKCRR